MFSGMGADLPGLTAFMLSLSRLVTTWTFAIGAPFVLFLAIYFFNTSYSTPSGRLFFDKLVFKVPLFGNLILR